jgi:uncharacterized protein YoxC
MVTFLQTSSVFIEQLGGFMLPTFIAIVIGIGVYMIQLLTKLNEAIQAIALTVAEFKGNVSGQIETLNNKVKYLEQEVHALNDARRQEHK